jgi:hypothetical protein
MAGWRAVEGRQMSSGEIHGTRRRCPVAVVERAGESLR